MKASTLKGIHIRKPSQATALDRFTEEQIVRALREVETGGKKAVDQQRDLGVSNATWYIWNRKYGGLEVNEAKRLKELEQENNKLKRIVPNLMLENEAVLKKL